MIDTDQYRLTQYRYRKFFNMRIEKSFNIRYLGKLLAPAQDQQRMTNQEIGKLDLIELPQTLEFRPGLNMN
jgi:hypothetical protein